MLVEGVGGWLVPIARDYTVADLAAEFALPVVIVVKNRLGALNHAALTLHHIRSLGLQCAGLILNSGPLAAEDTYEPQDIATMTNQGVLEDTLEVPVLFTLAYGQASL